MADTLAGNSYDFGPGSGRIDISSRSGIKLAPGITPADVILVSGPLFINGLNAETSYYGQASWNWQIRLKGRSDVATFSMAFDVLPDGTFNVYPWGSFETFDSFDGRSFTTNAIMPGGITFADGTVWSANYIATQLHLPANSGNAVLGSLGNDSITGNGSPHTFLTGYGTDTVVGSKADEVFDGGTPLPFGIPAKPATIRLGDAPGIDTLTSYWVDDTVHLPTGVRLSQLHVERDGVDAYVTWGTSDALRIKAFDSQTFNNNEPGKLAFSNGETLSFANLRTQYLQAPATDTSIFLPDSQGVYTWSQRRGSRILALGETYSVKLTMANVSIRPYVETRTIGTGADSFQQLIKGVRIIDLLTGQTLDLRDGVANSGAPGMDYTNNFLRSERTVLQLANGLNYSGVQLAALITQGQSPIFNSVLQGGERDDTLIATPASNRISGGGGDDLLILDLGPVGQDTVIFNLGDGQDTVHSSTQEGYVLELGGGIKPTDVVLDAKGQLSLLTGVEKVLGDRPSRIEFIDGTVWDEARILAEMGSGTAVNTLQGTDDGDTLAGTARQDLIDGLRGDDVINGGGGSDTLRGGVGNDTLIAGLGGSSGSSNGGADLLDGGEGNDLLMADLGAATLQGGRGDDRITLQDGNTVSFTVGDGHDTIDTPQAQYTLQFGLAVNRNDVRISRPLTGQDPRSTFIGLQAPNGMADRIDGLLPSRIVFADGTTWGAQEINAATFKGTFANDRIEGGAGWDLLTGQEGDDVISGGTGLDTMIGGAGADTYLFAKADVQDTIVGDDQDTLRLVDARYAEVVYSGIDANYPDQLVLNVGNKFVTVTLDNATRTPNMSVQFTDRTVKVADLLKLRVAPENKAVNGTAASDTLYGGQGNDTLNGLNGNDKLTGDFGDDSLVGGAGRDTLSGNIGLDTLVGGTGNDTYLFTMGDGRDTIVENDATWFNSDVLQTGFNAHQLWLTRAGNDLYVRALGTADAVTIKSWFLGSRHQVEKITSQDGKTLTNTRVNALVTAMAQFDPDFGVATSPTPEVASKLSTVMASSWR